MEGPSAAVSERQYGIRHLLAGMTLLGLALGLGRVILPSAASFRPPRIRTAGGPLRDGRLQPDRHRPLHLVCVSRWSRMLPLAIGWMVYAAVASLAEVGVLILFLGAPGDTEVFVAFGVINIAKCVAVWLTCVVLRWTGFQLLRRPPQTSGT